MLDNQIELKRFIFACIREYLDLQTFGNMGICRICEFHRNDKRSKPINLDHVCESCQAERVI